VEANVERVVEFKQDYEDMEVYYGSCPIELTVWDSVLETEHFQDAPTSFIATIN
jgi:hypothetical protein